MRGLAKVAENYIKKGTQLYVEGKLRTRSYDDANGITKYTTEIYADEIKLLGKRTDSGNDGFQSTEAKQEYSSQPAPQPSSATTNMPLANEPEDDLPF